MSRKKQKLKLSPKLKKSTLKRSNPLHDLRKIDLLEKDFRRLPAKIAVQCNKQLTLFKKQSKKLSKYIDKIRLQLKKSKLKQERLAGKNTLASKKALLISKRNATQLEKLLSSLSAQLIQINTYCHALEQRETKFMLLNKKLPQIEKELFSGKKKPSSLAEHTPLPEKNSEPKVYLTELEQLPVNTSVINELAEETRN